MVSYEFLEGLLACRAGERFERATEVLYALVGELAGQLDLVGDAPDLGLKGTAAGAKSTSTRRSSAGSRVRVTKPALCPHSSTVRSDGGFND
ncbi:hypothetical protein [Microvirga tunisiensis]|uniref:hypothetical protein n=1 Tax=Microvirga tunisiensis TaxID=2108360 RepID=UPI00129CDF5A|nr:hypothetical protein [Microvirga tunisiensis]